MENTQQTYTVTCLDCQQPITFSKAPSLGSVLRCESCGVELEIVTAEPLTVNYLYVRK